MSNFPAYRPRRLRRTEALRRLVRETHLQPSQLVLPLFVRSGSGVRRPVGSMPGCFRPALTETYSGSVAFTGEYPCALSMLAVLSALALLPNVPTCT